MRRGVVCTYDNVGHRGVGEDGGLLERGWMAVLAAERGRIKNVIQ